MNDYQMIRQRIQERSREKLRQRKQKRMRVLAVCVPLLLCISLGGVYAWQAGWLKQAQPESQLGRAEIGIPETQAAIWQESLQENRQEPVEEIVADSAVPNRGVTMELTGGEIVTAFADENLVYLVSAELEGIMTRSRDESSNVSEETETAGDDQAHESYRLKIFGKATREYILQDGAVTDVKTGTTYRATQLQWDTLCGLLGIREE